ncbi:MAG: 2-succinyl-6-hydroxy-2,4-cyclohexadiene-1-carboxylate synthase [Chlorobiaceae bacterium]
MAKPLPDIPLHFTTLGSESLPRIIFLHGFLGSGSDWLPIARKLEKDYCSVMVDLPGHGSAGIEDGAAAAEGYFERTVEALAERVRQVASPPCRLVGYSMGGRIALALLLRHPALFSQALIVSASPGLRTQEERVARRSSDECVARKIERNFAGFLDAWYRAPLFSTLKHHPVFREVERERKHNDPRNLALALRFLGTGNQPSMWDALPENRVPVHFFAGEKDERYVEIARQMVKLCPGSDCEILPSCGHALQLENRELFVKRLQLFFKQQEPLRL